MLMKGHLNMSNWAFDDIIIMMMMMMMVVVIGVHWSLITRWSLHGRSRDLIIDHYGWTWSINCTLVSLRKASSHLPFKKSPLLFSLRDMNQYQSLMCVLALASCPTRPLAAPEASPQFSSMLYFHCRERQAQVTSCTFFDIGWHWPHCPPSFWLAAIQGWDMRELYHFRLINPFSSSRVAHSKFEPLTTVMIMILCHVTVLISLLTLQLLGVFASPMFTILSICMCD